MPIINPLKISLLLLLAGCTSSVTLVNPTVTATQQLIVSSSEAKAISSLANNLPKELTYLDTSNYTGSKYQLALFINWLLDNKVPITQDIKAASVIVQIYTSVDSYNSESYLIGLPAFKVGPIASTPELAAYAKDTLIAINQISYFAFDAKTGMKIAEGSSKYGVQEYSVTKLAFLASMQKPKLSNIIK